MTPATATKPYLIRALYEWALDNSLTPQIIVHSGHPECRIPSGWDQEGQLTLNIAPGAVQGMIMDNQTIQFQARFSGIAHQISVPMDAVMALFARENGQGMFFHETPPETTESDEEPTPPDSDPPPPKLRLV